MGFLISTYPVNTGRKLNVHKIFRRRPGRLLNVLWTFNLRPVSTGQYAIQNRNSLNNFSIYIKILENLKKNPIEIL